jgi:hypothetical protein
MTTGIPPPNHPANCRKNAEGFSPSNARAPWPFNHPAWYVGGAVRDGT